MKRKFILNPAAGRARVARGVSLLRRRVERKLGEFDYVLTRDRADIKVQTQRALREGYDQIVAVGGDGTLNGVANAFFEDGVLINPKSVLGVSDWGTGSDYFRTLREEGGGDWIDLIADFEPRQVDLGHLHYEKDPRLDTYFLNATTLGLSAEVVRRKNGLPLLVPGFLSYALPGLFSLFGPSSYRVQITFDGETHDEDMLALFVSKGGFLGGGMHLGRGGTLEDGKLQVTLARAMGPLRSVPRYYKLFTGRFEGDEQFLRRAATRVEVRSPAAVPVEFDGEAVGSTDIVITVKPRALPICFPR